MQANLARNVIASAVALATTCSFAADLTLTDVTAHLGPAPWMSGVYAAGDRAHWEVVWRRHLDGQDLVLAAPPIDFADATLVGVSLGFTNRCERLSITHATAIGQTVQLTYRKERLTTCDSHVARPLYAFALIGTKAQDVVARPEDN